MYKSLKLILTKKLNRWTKTGGKLTKIHKKYDIGNVITIITMGLIAVLFVVSAKVLLSGDFKSGITGLIITVIMAIAIAWFDQNKDQYFYKSHYKKYRKKIESDKKLKKLFINSFNAVKNKSLLKEETLQIANNISKNKKYYVKSNTVYEYNKELKNAMIDIQERLDKQFLEKKIKN